MKTNDDHRNEHTIIYVLLDVVRSRDEVLAVFDQALVSESSCY
jgi:hypothetical protein